MAKKWKKKCFRPIFFPKWLPRGPIWSKIWKFWPKKLFFLKMVQNGKKMAKKVFSAKFFSKVAAPWTNLVEIWKFWPKNFFLLKWSKMAKNGEKKSVFGQIFFPKWPPREKYGRKFEKKIFSLKMVQNGQKMGKNVFSANFFSKMAAQRTNLVEN